MIQITFIFIAVNLFWGFYSNNTWDDDCQTRFFNATNAFNDPSNFVSLWNRPLFMLVFSIPAQLGHWSIIVLQTLISVIGGWALVKTAKNLHLRYTFLAFPFLVFQPFVFGVSRYAMTEPLAILLISLSLLFYTQKNWKAFAIAGSLIPLARLELSLLLPFWFIPLWLQKKHKEIAVMGIPLLLWVIAGAAMHGGLSWFYEQTIGKEATENRYGHKSFSTYFERFQYVIGPVLFFFSVISLPKTFRTKQYRNLFLWPLIIGLLIYSIFSSILNMGNAAGFLRNLIPLSPYIVMLSLVGLNYWFTTAKKKSISIENTSKKWQSKWKKTIEKHNTLYQSSKKEILISAIVSLVITLFFYSYELESHHSLSKESIDPSLLTIQIVLFLLVLFSFKMKLIQRFYLVPLSCLVLLTGYTLIKEHPLANSNSERLVINKVANLYTLAELDNKKTYINHPWFFWAAGLDKFSNNTNNITKENLNKALPGEVAVVENHYSNRLGGDIDMNYFSSHKEWIEISSFNTPENDFFISIYQKSSSKKEHLNILNEYISSTNNKDGSAILLKGLYFLNTEKNAAKAIKTINSAYDSEANLFKIPLTLGKIHLKQKDLPSALQAFKKALKVNPENIEAHERIGAIYFNLGKLKNANRHFAFIEQKMAPTREEPKPTKIYISAKRNLAICNFRQKQYKPSFRHFNEIIQYKKDIAQDHYNIAMIYRIANKKESSCKALNQAYKMGMTDIKSEIKQYCN